MGPDWRRLRRRGRPATLPPSACTSSRCVAARAAAPTTRSSAPTPISARRPAAGAPKSTSTPVPPAPTSARAPARATRAISLTASSKIGLWAFPRGSPAAGSGISRLPCSS